MLNPFETFFKMLGLKQQTRNEKYWKGSELDVSKDPEDRRVTKIFLQRE